MTYGEVLSKEYTKEYKERMSISLWEKISSVFPSFRTDTSAPKEIIHVTTALISHLSEIIIEQEKCLFSKDYLLITSRTIEKALRSRNEELEAKIPSLEAKIPSLEDELNRTARIRMMGDS